jgi:hypothetical protein
MISHQRPLSIMYEILSLTNSTLFNCWYDSLMLKKLYLIHDSFSPFHRNNEYSLADSVPPLSHLTCTPTKSNLYFDIYFPTAMSEPALYRLLTFHVPNLISIFFSFGRLSKESVQVRGPLWHFVTSLFVSPTPNPQAGGPPCRLSATNYSIYSQLPSISGGRLLHPQP